jgi:hypothetical protein
MSVCHFAEFCAFSCRRVLQPSAGTFTQRYWASWQYWETGGCVVLMTPGEVNADGYDGYLTTATINGQIAEQHNCATVLIEHRFFGLSNPKPDLSVASLQLLTIDQGMTHGNLR